MVVHQARGLHEGIDDHRTAEAKTPTFQGLGHGFGGGCLGRCLPDRGPGILHRPSVDEVPQERGEGLAALAHVQIGPGAADGGLDLGPAPHDAGIPQKARHIRLAVAGHALGIKAVEGGAEGLALLQDGDPGQPGLEPVQDQLLPQGPVVPLRHPPFGVVIVAIEGVVTGPAAANGGFHGDLQGRASTGSRVASTGGGESGSAGRASPC